MSRPQRPVLILGGGINGCATARELALCGVPVCLVEANDLAFGATSKSSRLIHGGLRYLEYGELDLVRESLAERARLLQLAPQFVRPLRLFIPVSNRFGGLANAWRRMLGTARRGRTARSVAAPARPRGLWIVRAGLWLYDRYARLGRRSVSPAAPASRQWHRRLGSGTGVSPVFSATLSRQWHRRLAGVSATRDPARPADRERESGCRGPLPLSRLPEHSVYRRGEPGLPAVDDRYRWLCSYWDAQITYPERLVLALLHDARRLATEKGIPLQVFTYHRAGLAGPTAEVYGADGAGAPVLRLQPSVIVNATGAWGDHTLARLGVPSRRLFGGTKGSHFVTTHQGLRQALRGNAVYAEAPDGRLVFLLPFDDAVLVGTTDERFEQSPEQAVASDQELDYLLDMANCVFPQARLSRDDILLHYSGVRPLPSTHDAGRDAAPAPSAITRRHRVEANDAGPVPVLTLIGGKLTTCRSLAECTADLVLQRLGRERSASSRRRPLPGGEDYPPTADSQACEHEALARSSGFTVAQVRAVWALCGTLARDVLAGARSAHRENLAGTSLPVAMARWAIRNEWVTRLADLVERRLMLLYEPALSLTCLRQLAALLVEEGVIEARAADEEVHATVERLRTNYGREEIAQEPPSHVRLGRDGNFDSRDND